MADSRICTTDEIWKPCVGFEGFYEVSDLGRARSLSRQTPRKDRWGRPSIVTVKGKVLHPVPFGKSGHVGVNLWRHGDGVTRLVHRLVLEAFVGPRPEGME